MSDDITTHARVWLERRGYTLPDPWTTDDVVAGINLLHPGGRRGYLRKLGLWDEVKRLQRQRIAKSVPRTPDGTFIQQKEVHA